MKTEKLTSIKDYAKRKGVSVQAIYKQINAKRLKTAKKFGVIVIKE